MAIAKSEQSARTQIAEHREDLEEIADSDLPCNKIAETLLAALDKED